MPASRERPGLMSTNHEIGAGVLPMANDAAVRHEKALSEPRPEIGGSPASADGSHQEPMLVIEQQALPLVSSSMPSSCNPTQAGAQGSALTSSSHEGYTNYWLHETIATHPMADTDETTLHPCITDMDEDESMSKEGIGSKAANVAAVSRATALPAMAVVEKEVGEYVSCLEQLGSFDSVDWTVRDGSSPVLSAVLRNNGDHPAREETEATSAIGAATDLPPPEDIGMYQPYHSFASALLPLEHLPPLELTTSCLLAGSDGTPFQPMRTSPPPPHQTRIFSDPYIRTGMGAVDGLGDLKRPPYLQLASPDLSALLAPEQAFTDRRSLPSASGVEAVAGKASSTSRTTEPSSSRSLSKSAKKARPDRTNGGETEGATPKVEEGGASAPRRVGRWTREEDEILIAAVAKMRDFKDRVVWSKVSQEYFHGSRNATQCKSRWGKALSPAVDRSPFTAEEDAIIIDARRRGMRFCDISRLCLPGRQSDRIRFRYTHALDPSRKEKKDIPWSDAEKQVLVDAQRAMGNKWTTIAMLLPGRSDNDVKNFWYNQKDSFRRAQNRQLAEEVRVRGSPSRSSGADLATVHPVTNVQSDSPAATPTAV